MSHSNVYSNVRALGKAASRSIVLVSLTSSVFSPGLYLAHFEGDVPFSSHVLSVSLPAHLPFNISSLLCGYHCPLKALLAVPLLCLPFPWLGCTWVERVFLLHVIFTTFPHYSVVIIVHLQALLAIPLVGLYMGGALAVKAIEGRKQSMA
eukprot:1136295-Pelagomonas_calceolata.AAC.3